MTATHITHAEAEQLFEEMLRVGASEVKELRRRACKRHLSPLQVLMEDEDMQQFGDSITIGISCQLCGTRVQPGSLMMVNSGAAFESLCTTCAEQRETSPRSPTRPSSSHHAFSEADDQ